MKALDIANWFLSKESMSPKKIQKLVYYAYSWYLTLMNDSEEELTNKLFTEDIKAWVHGPVVYSIYREFKDYGYNEISQKTVDESIYTDDMLDVLNQVWDVYGGYSANELESITHQEDPWIKARGELSPLQNGYENLDDRVIFTYYLSQMDDD